MLNNTNIKGNYPNVATYYRDIALNNILAKTYLRITLNRLSLWTQPKEIIFKHSLDIKKVKALTTYFLLQTIIRIVI